MKPRYLSEVALEHHDKATITVVKIGDEFYVNITGMLHGYFGPYKTLEEAFEKHIIIDKGIQKKAFTGRGYYIVLPIGTKSGSICRCLGHHKPFYFEVKHTLTADDIQEQKTYANSVSSDKNRAIGIAGEQNLVIVGCCDKVGSTIWLDTSRVKKVDDMEQPDWTYKSCIPLAF